jgi:FkbM family methyltransferase
MKQFIKKIIFNLGYEIYRTPKTNSRPVDQNPFWHYCASFDALGLIKKFELKSISVSPNHLTNFLGVKIRPEFFPTLSLSPNTIDPTPNPNNFHADVAEWGSCLRAVDLSKNEFTMLELGCGWGCWMNNLGVTAKNSGKKIKLYGIEADDGHLTFAKIAFKDNHITENEYHLFPGIAGKKSSIALFPKLDSGIDWGGEARFNLSEEEAATAIASGKYIQVPVVDIVDIFKDKPALDIIHVDIQGAELDLLTEIFDFLNTKAKSVFIGTHSKQVEGGLYDLFLSNKNWKLEMERPNIHIIENGLPINICDGVQYWRNISLI